MGAARPDTGTADAELAVRLFALSPHGTGLHLRARPGPARDALLALLRTCLPAGAPWRVCPPGITDDRLLGGMDLAAALSGRSAPRVAPGLLADADGGVVVASGAERMGARLAALLASALDEGVVRLERDGTAAVHPARFGLLLLDEGEAEEVPAALRERVAFRIELDEPRGDAGPPTAGSGPAAAVSDDEMAQTLCEVAIGFGIGSARAALLAVRAARTAARLAGRNGVMHADVLLAARLVMAHRATRLPPPGEAPQPEQREPEQQEMEQGDGGGGETGNGTAEDAAAAVLAAVRAAVPSGLLDGSGGGKAAGTGRSGGTPCIAPRGRPAGVRAGRPVGGARLHLLATVMAALPRQMLRRPGGRARVALRAADLRVRRCKARPRQTTVFVVDASGSAALHRLAEAKGAVELLLGDCYTGRHRVGLVAFRGTGAELLLPPTRALARARRCLAELPGGGGTPLAAGLRDAEALGTALRRRGESPLLVLLTDGRGNVALDGAADRKRAGSDAAAMAGRVRASGLPALVLDISPRPAPEAGALALAMGARYVPLPRADAAGLSRAVRDAA